MLSGHSKTLSLDERGLRHETGVSDAAPLRVQQDIKKPIQFSCGVLEVR
jgi:hypothetical protein